MHLVLSVWSHGHPARVAELADALASGASVLIGRAGSSPAPGTISSQIIELHNARDGLGFCVAGVCSPWSSRRGSPWSPSLSPLCSPGLNRGYPTDHTFGRNLAIRSANPCLSRVGVVRIGLS